MAAGIRHYSIVQILPETHRPWPFRAISWSIFDEEIEHEMVGVVIRGWDVADRAQYCGG
jgi:hypothetical protein